MENLYLFIVVVLFILAITDLVVGVSNDAVNFLNSAIGAKVASFRLIMVVAALGVFVGATFSSGMMEVARKGIFNPQYFYFGEIMIIFLAVMLTDVILLDGFNTLGMPTSTTVSIVFELLGAAVAISVIKIHNDPNSIPLYEYINTSSALAIISGILLSVVVAFSVGAVVQFLTRLLFSFNAKNLRGIVAGIFGGIAIAIITYFILIKGAKGASFMSSEVKDYVKNNTWMILGFSFVGWSLILFLLQWAFKFNIFKFIILAGTFALAMAFAGNDLVNFIGVPLAGLASFKDFAASGLSDPGALLMESMAGKVKTDSYLLLIAGLIMVVVLFTSRKAKSVVKTSLDLARQDEGEERFGSSMMGRALVRMATQASKNVNSVLPKSFLTWVDKRLDDTEYRERVAQEENPPSFDMVRASVNLVVASVLIALATSLKLPLSTTYVTFMVAMGTSLSDRAWGRESAVYRVTGVFSVIGGWFLTALIAFTSAFIVALLIHWTGIIGIIGMVGVAFYVMYRTQIIHKNRNVVEVEEVEVKEEVQLNQVILDETSEQLSAKVQLISQAYCKCVDALNREDRKELRDVLSEVKVLNDDIHGLKLTAIERIKNAKMDMREIGLAYIHCYDNLKYLSKILGDLAEPSYTHIDNNHTSFEENQKEEMRMVCQGIVKYASHCTRAIAEHDFSKNEAIQQVLEDYLQVLKKFNKVQFKRLKNEKAGTKISMLYFEILNKTKLLAQGMMTLVLAQETLVNETKDKFPTVQKNQAK